MTTLPRQVHDRLPTQALSAVDGYHTTPYHHDAAQHDHARYDMQSVSIVALRYDMIYSTRASLLPHPSLGDSVGTPRTISIRSTGYNTRTFGVDKSFTVCDDMFCICTLFDCIHLMFSSLPSAFFWLLLMFFLLSRGVIFTYLSAVVSNP